MLKVGDIQACIDDRPDDGIFRVRSKLFADEELFELEQKHIFERTWSFLGLDSQVQKPNDFITTFIGRTPVIVIRNAVGTLGAFLNVCRHKGALLARTESGNRRTLVCSYHGWTYDSSGRNVNIKDKDAGCYPSEFDQQNHDLLPLARFESYKGLLFGSLNSDVPPLEVFLGEAKPLVDLAMEQGPDGMELVPGRVVYTFEGNWKLQADNGSDSYHLTSTHPSLMSIVQRREQEKVGNVGAKQYDWRKRFTQTGGIFTFKHGHTAVWLNQGQPENRPLHKNIEHVRARVGDLRAEWMMKSRNLTIFPNLQIADATSLLIRTFRPLAVDKTEMRMWCMAPIGETPEVRSWRIRQFEDFFNVSGLATPDDTALYEDAQIGFRAEMMDWLQGYQRGATALSSGPNDAARELGMKPLASSVGPYNMQTETCFQPLYREWARLLQAGVSGTPAYET